jgi:acyl-CoA thioester hydrolase
MPAVYEHRHRVLDREMDTVGHVNNLEYLKWLQDAALAHSAAQGWPADAYRSAGHGWVVRSHYIEYLVPAFADDDIVVRTWIADMKRVTSLRRYEIIRPTDGKQTGQSPDKLGIRKFFHNAAVQGPIRNQQRI